MSGATATAAPWEYPFRDHRNCAQWTSADIESAFDPLNERAKEAPGTSPSLNAVVGASALSDAIPSHAEGFAR